MSPKKRKERTDQAGPREMVRKLGAKCSICPLRDQVPVLGEGPLEAAVAVIGEAPGRDETKVGRPFIGRSGESLDAYLMQCDMPRSTVFVSNAVACFPPGGDMKTFLTMARRDHKEKFGTGKKAPVFNSPIDCCRPRLFNELRVSFCKKCGKFLQGPQDLQCVCRDPLVVKRPTPTVLVPMGNAAMESLLGFEGITKWRGSPLQWKRGR